jgi:hypothetical protein
LARQTGNEEESAWIVDDGCRRLICWYPGWRLAP